MKRLTLLGLVFVFVCVLPAWVAAYSLSGYKWPVPNATFYVDIPGSGGIFNTGFETALNRWNAATPYFQYSIVHTSFDPCSNPSSGTVRNGAKFDTTDCGAAFGASTLAVTHTWVSGGTTIIQSGVVFNSTKTWDVYSGPYQSGSHAGVQDFARVAVHELGHALGLGHENSLPSIMISAVAPGTTIEIPQQDDKNGVAALYGPPPDNVAPTVTITSPTSAATYSTAANSISLGGNSQDNVGVTAVNWASDRGVSGTCTFSGFSTSVNWTCTGIVLFGGSNVLTVTARDAVGNSGSDVITVTLPPAPPVISAVRSAPGSIGTAVVTWTTDSPADSQVDFGSTAAYGAQSTTNAPMSTSHTVNLSGLSLNSTYHYRVTSRDNFGGLSTSSDFTFTTFSIPNVGGFSRTTDGVGALLSGYGRIQPGSGSTTPSGVAIFAYRQGGVLVSEAGVPDSPLISSGRAWAEVSGGVVNTGFALVNPNNAAVRVYFDLRGKNGDIVKSGYKDYAPGEHSASFLDQEPFLSGPDFQGTVSFNSTSPVSLIALRGFYNERTPTEFLMSTLPVIDVAPGALVGTQVIPHFAAGGGFTTQILLVNPTGSPQTGAIEFRDTGGSLKVVNIDGVPGTGSSYNLSANGAAKFVITAVSADLTAGSVRIIPTSGGAAPTPLVLFSYKPAGITVSEATVPVTMGSAFRMYVELSPASLINSGIAIANAGGVSGIVTLSVTTLDGTPVTSRNLPIGAFAQIGGFLDELIPSLAGQPLQGVLRITTNLNVSVVGLRSHYNDRSPQPDFLMATTPPSLETALPTSAERFFPQIANGVSFTTQVILFSGTSGQSANGDLTFFQSGPGAVLNLDLH